MTAKVKTDNSELKTPKNPAISQAADNCHWMAYSRNSPKVEASRTAKNPKHRQNVLNKAKTQNNDDEEVKVSGLNSRLSYPDMAVSVQSARIRVRVLFQKF